MIQNVLFGIASYKTSFSLIRKLNLWKYFAIPVLISMGTAVMIGILAWKLGSIAGGWFSKLWFWEWGAAGFRSAGNFLGGAVIVLFGIIIFRHVVMAFSAPFMSPVSEKIEKHHHPNAGFPEQSGFFKLLWRGLRINIRNLILELVLTIPVFLLGFIPVIGFISAPLILIIQSYYAGFGNMDYTLERHLSYADSISFVRKNRGVAIGNGLIFSAVLMIPFFGILLVFPLSVTAASGSTLILLDRKCQKEGLN